MVYEEKVLSGYDIQPLQAVGWEGILHFMLQHFFIILTLYQDKYIQIINIMFF